MDTAKEGYRLQAEDDGYALARKTYRMTLNVAAAFARTPEWQGLARRLGLAPDRRTCAIDVASDRTQGDAPAGGTLYLATRSPLGIIAHLAKGSPYPPPTSNITKSRPST